MAFNGYREGFNPGNLLQNLTGDFLIPVASPVLMKIITWRFRNKWDGPNQLPTGTSVLGPQIGKLTGWKQQVANMEKPLQEAAQPRVFEGMA